MTPKYSLHLGNKLIHPLGSVGGRTLATAIMAIACPADKVRVVQIGDLTHDLHLSIFPSLVSDRRSEPIINLWGKCQKTSRGIFLTHTVHVSQKGRHYTLVHIFAKYGPIFKFFHRRTQLEICNKIINKDSTSPQMCCSHYLVNCQCSQIGN